MQLEDGEQVIGKVEKKIRASHKGENLQLHIKGDTFRKHIVASIFNTLARESYYEAKQHKFFTLTKSYIEKDCVFLTLATKEARDSILKYGIVYKPWATQS